MFPFLSSIPPRLRHFHVLDASRWPYREWLGRTVATIAVTIYCLRRIAALPEYLAASDAFSRFLAANGSPSGQVRLLEILSLALWGCETGILMIYVVAFLIRRNARGIACGFMEVVYPFLVSGLPVLISLAPQSYDRLVPRTSVWYAAGLTAILGLMLLGAAINLTGLWTLRRAFTVMTEAREFVCRGLFRWVRHPLYAGHFVMFFGLLLVHLHVWTALIYAVFVVAQVLRSRLEERKLEAVFPEYRAYRAHVGMFFPRLRRRPVNAMWSAAPRNV